MKRAHNLKMYLKTFKNISLTRTEHHIPVPQEQVKSYLQDLMETSAMLKIIKITERTIVIICNKYRLFMSKKP